MVHTTIQHKTDGLKMGDTTIQGFIQLDQEISVQLIAVYTV